MLSLIWKEKFDIVLPKVMKEHNIDMWIQVIRYGNPDPLEHDLGGTGGHFIFTDKGSERIERAVLGGGAEYCSNRVVHMTCSVRLNTSDSLCQIEILSALQSICLIGSRPLTASRTQIICI